MFLFSHIREKQERQGREGKTCSKGAGHCGKDLTICFLPGEVLGALTKMFFKVATNVLITIYEL